MDEDTDRIRRSESHDSAPQTQEVAGEGESSSLNRLSCVRCKDRKIRCSRHEPTCNRCNAQNLKCQYPIRQKRRPVRPLPGNLGSLVDQNAITIILDRLQRIEERFLPNHDHGQVHQGSSPAPSYVTQVNHHAVSVGGPRSTGIVTPSGPHPGLASPHSNHVSPSIPWSSTSAFATTAATPPAIVDATAVLKDAVGHVQRLRLQGYVGSVITEDITIPPHLAKAWVKNYFAHMPTDMFMSLIDRKVIELVPDMMGLPHVHLDSCIIVIYYSVLWHGCAIASTGNNSAESYLWHYTKRAYLGCLRALPGWQREATGTITDLIAALSMARVSGECFDYEMSWKMYKQAVEYAQGLGMHNLDDSDRSKGVYMGLDNPNISDNDRKAFWDLLQVDTFFRLLFNKPPSITGNIWKVNLPWLCTTDNQVPQPVTAMTFLINSRVTLLLLRYFAMLEEDAGNPAQLMRRTEGMCEELKRLFEDWNLAKWVKDVHFNTHDTWTVADVTLSSYTCIIFMLHKAAALDSSSPCPITTDTDVPETPMALYAARHIVEMLGWLLEKYPNSATMSHTFGAYRAYVPFAYLVSRILKVGDDAGDGGGVGAYREDMENMERVGRIVTEIALLERDFVPLARAIASLNSEVRKKAATASVRP